MFFKVCQHSNNILVFEAENTVTVSPVTDGGHRRSSTSDRRKLFSLQDVSSRAAVLGNYGKEKDVVFHWLIFAILVEVCVWKRVCDGFYISFQDTE